MARPNRRTFLFFAFHDRDYFGWRRTTRSETSSGARVFSPVDSPIRCTGRARSFPIVQPLTGGNERREILCLRWFIIVADCVTMSHDVSNVRAFGARELFLVRWTLRESSKNGLMATVASKTTLSPQPVNREHQKEDGYLSEHLTIIGTTSPSELFSMKLLLLAGLLAVTFCHFDFTDKHRLAGKQLVFDLDTQVASGMPGSSFLHSIFRLSAKAHVTYKSEDQIVLRLTDIKSGHLNTDVEDVDKLLPFKAVDEEPLDAEMKRALELPVSYLNNNGLVSNVIFDKEDNLWSMNTKRAIISMTQMDQQKARMETPLIEDEMSTMETSVEGECKVFYTMPNELKMKREGEKKMWTLTKNIDFAQCKKTANIFYGYTEAEMCKDCDRKHVDENEEHSHHVNRVHRSTVIDYTFSEEQIEKIELLSMYVVPNVVRSKNSDLVSTVVMAMKLREKKEASHHMTEGPKNGLIAELLYSAEADKLIEKFERFGEKDLKEIPVEHIPNEKIIDVIEKLARAMQDENKGMSIYDSAHYTTLIRYFRTLTLKRLEELFYEMDHLQIKLARSLYVQALTSAGTYNTVKMFVDKVIENKISMSLAAQAVKTLNIRKPSAEQVDMIVRLCETSDMKTLDFAYQSCWLSAGAVMNKWAKMNDQQVNDSKARGYVTVLLNKYMEAKDTLKKVVALKSLANAGLDASFDYLRDIILNKDEEKMVRMQAIDALRQLRATIPHKIHTVLLPVFKDVSEVPEIRMTAFSMIMHTLPEQKILDQIVKTISKETNSHVASFAVSMINALSKSSEPCQKKLAKDFMDIINIAHLKIDLHDNMDKYFHIPMYNHEHDFGAVFNLATMLSDDSPIFKEVMLGWDQFAFGKWHKYFAQIGFTQENMEKVIEQVTELINQKLRSIKWDEQIVVRGKRTDKTPRDMLKDLVKKLRIVSRENKQKSFAMFYIRWKNMDHAVYSWDLDAVEVASTHMEKLIKSGLHGSILKKLFRDYGEFDYYMATDVFETYTKIPTSLGLPLVTRQTNPLLFHLAGNADLQIGRTWDISLKTHVTATSAHVIRSDIYSPFGAAGVKTVFGGELNLPIDFVVKYGSTDSSMKKRLEITVEAPKDKMKIAAIHTIPSTYVLKGINEFVESDEMMTIANRYLTHTEHTIKTKYMEMDECPIVVRGHGYDFFALDRPVDVLFTGHNHFQINLEPTSKAPKSWTAVLEFEAAEEQVESEKPELEHFYNTQESNSFFALDDQSEDEESERTTEYRESLRKYSSKKANKMSMKIKLSGNGGAYEQKASLSVDLFCDDKNTHCRLVAHVLRTPVPFYKETEDWSAKIVLNTLWPESTNALSRLSEKKHRELTGSLDAYFGSGTRHTQWIKMKLQGEQSKVLRALISSELKKLVTPMERRELLEKANLINQLKLQTTYELSENNKEFVTGLAVALRYAKYFNIYMEQGNQELPKNQFNMKLTTDQDQMRYLNATVETASRTMKMYEYQLPYSIPEMVTFVKRLSPIGMIEKSDVCRVEESKIHTFMNAIYTMPLQASDCWTLLVQDCIEKEQGSKFAVLQKYLDMRSEEKKLRILIRDIRIEAQVVRGEMEVQVGREHVNFERDAARLEALGLKLREGVLVFENHDLFVMFDGKTITTRIANIYKYRQCGLCSAEYEDDQIILPTNEKTSDISKFHESFIDTKTEQCSVDREQLRRTDNYKSSVQDRMWYADDDYESHTDLTTSPEEETLILADSYGKLCFSLKPIKRCPKGLIPLKKTATKIGFACLERDSELARRLEKQCKNKEVIDAEELMDEKVQMRNVRSHYECSA
ncbi:hypothetical protein QR680_002876 [Steinernema hermaphroditum]|uniref:Vitellogenin domain-containing protein n=1 Tax=Steinernema hermaphroditum TaxID=289476 RepID=A0AA39LIY7_9BILA|nr:hypothetical protein QR680_002876 [Steinernema hermaphroditum]